jgi:hypothetical protein
MGSGILKLLYLIVCPGNNAVIAHHDGPHGHFPHLIGFFGFFERLSHEILVYRLYHALE